jgi:hypothetical protein
MDTPHKADPAIYPRLREHMLTSKLQNYESGAVQKALMDWHVTNGTVTVLAGADGSASMYLSSGGGFIGGGQGYPELREAAQRAIGIAIELKSRFKKTENFDLPQRENVVFFITTDDGVYTAVVSEAEVRRGKSPFAALGGAMQAIVTGYRLRQQKRSSEG